MTTGSPAVRIDQVFHGYDRGHRELASSLTLDPDSRETMLLNSDILAELSGSQNSYLTCYPLPAASRHVLARTWSAGATYRPGSVWTHSLVLDFQALALLPDLLILDTLLMRAGELDRNKSIKPIVIKPGSFPGIVFKPSSNAAIAIAGLYGTSATSVDVPTRSLPENDLLALALWRQMWPSLRRDFNFVTGASSQRSATGVEWMLRFSHQKADSPKLGIGLQALLDDLPKTGLTPLRRFLSRYAVEAPDPRQVGVPLAELWAVPALDFESRLRAVRSVTQVIPLPRLNRDLVTAELAKTDEPRALLAVVKEFGDQTLDIDPSMAVKMAGLMDTASLISLLDNASAVPRDRLGGRVFEAVVRGCEPNALAHVSQGSTRAAMVRLRPDLLGRIHFWPDSDNERAKLVRGYDGNSDLSVAWALMGHEIGFDTAKALLDRRWYPSTEQLPTLLAKARKGVAQLLAAYALENPNLISILLKDAPLGVFECLADAQIASERRPKSPAIWCAAACRFDRQKLAPSTLVVGYVACIDIDEMDGFAAAKQVYDPLQHLVRHYRLSREQDRYLQSAIAVKTRGWGLADYLTRSALARWPVGTARCGALGLSSEQTHLRDLVDAAQERVGREGLRGVLLDPALPHEARVYITSKLKVQPRKSWWF